MKLYETLKRMVIKNLSIKNPHVTGDFLSDYLHETVIRILQKERVIRVLIMRMVKNKPPTLSEWEPIYYMDFIWQINAYKAYFKGFFCVWFQIYLHFLWVEIYYFCRRKTKIHLEGNKSPKIKDLL